MRKHNSVSQLDSPWHVGTLQKNPDEPRRHRAHCKYYNAQTKCCTTAQSYYFQHE